MTEHMSLANHFLVAMPTANQSYLQHAVIYVCEHHQQGTVGLIINHPTPYPIQIIFEQLDIHPKQDEHAQIPLMFGGPLQQERGFVLHRPVGNWRSSLVLMEDQVTMTTSNDIIRAVATGSGPKDVLIALGYMGWTSYQVEREIMDNLWLVCPFKPELLYDIPFADRWYSAGLLLGIDMNQLGIDSGHA